MVEAFIKTLTSKRITHLFSFLFDNFFSYKEIFLPPDRLFRGFSVEKLRRGVADDLRSDFIHSQHLLSLLTHLVEALKRLFFLNSSAILKTKKNIQSKFSPR